MAAQAQQRPPSYRSKFGVVHAVTQQAVAVVQMTEANKVAQVVDAEDLSDVQEEDVEGLEEFLFVRQRLRALEGSSTEVDGMSTAEVQAQLSQLTVLVGLEQLMQWACANDDNIAGSAAQVCRGWASQSLH